ncbi:hypothetical protein D3C81_2061900 [compost metagenome]
MSQGGGPRSRTRAVRAKAMVTGASASSSVAWIRAFSRTSNAPLASATASGWLVTSGNLGSTSTSSEKPIVLIARAAEPTFPGWLGFTITKRTRENA